MNRGLSLWWKLGVVCFGVGAFVWKVTDQRHPTSGAEARSLPLRPDQELRAPSILNADTQHYIRQLAAGLNSQGSARMETMPLKLLLHDRLGEWPGGRSQ